MTIHACDVCGKKINDKAIIVGIGLFSAHVELCKDCALPVITFLDSKNLLQLELVRNGLKQKLDTAT